MMLLGTQMGLHQPLSARDFTKVPLNLNDNDYSRRVKTWKACNIVAHRFVFYPIALKITKLTRGHSVSVGCGLPALEQSPDSSLNVAPEYMTSSFYDASLDSHLQIEQFRRRVTLAFSLMGPNPVPRTSEHERLVLYRLLNSVFSDLERDIINLSSKRNTTLIQLCFIFTQSRS